MICSNIRVYGYDWLLPAFRPSFDGIEQMNISSLKLAVTRYITRTGFLSGAPGGYIDSTEVTTSSEWQNETVADRLAVRTIKTNHFVRPDQTTSSRPEKVPPAAKPKGKRASKAKLGKAKADEAAADAPVPAPIKRKPLGVFEDETEENITHRGPVGPHSKITEQRKTNGIQTWMPNDMMIDRCIDEVLTPPKDHVFADHCKQVVGPFLNFPGAPIAGCKKSASTSKPGGL
jgi:hypothetical protein